MFRMTRLLVAGVLSVALCFLALLPLSAFAYGVVPQTNVYCYVATSQSVNSGCQDSSGGAASVLAGKLNQLGVGDSSGCTLVRDRIWTVGTVPSEAGSGTLDYEDHFTNCYSGADAGTSTGNVTFGVTKSGPTSGCPNNSTLVGSQCICNAEFKLSQAGDSCVDSACDALAADLQGQSLSWTGRASYGCFQGCKLSATLRGYLASTNTTTTEGAIFADGTCAGDPATGTDPGTQPPDSTPCPARQCPGTVNGTAVCVACSGSTSDGPTTTTTDGPGTPGAGGGGTSTTTTTCDGTRCTTTTTDRNNNGEVTQTEETEESEESYCAKNPELAICQDSSFSPGACNGGAPSCDGDPIQCAIAVEQHLRACEFFEPQGPVVAAGEAAATGDTRPSGHPGNSAQQTGVSLASLIDQSDRISGSCPPDVSISVMGTAAVVSFGSICGPLALVGNAVVACGLLLALMIVFRR